MHEQILREFFEGKVGALGLARDVAGSTELTSPNALVVNIADKEDEFNVRVYHLIRLCDAVLSRELQPDDLATVGFALIASDKFYCDGDADEVLAEVICRLVLPEVNYSLTIENVSRFRAWLSRSELYPAKILPRGKPGKLMNTKAKERVSPDSVDYSLFPIACTLPLRQLLHRRAFRNRQLELLIVERLIDHQLLQGDENLTLVQRPLDGYGPGKMLCSKGLHRSVGRLSLDLALLIVNVLRDRPQIDPAEMNHTLREHHIAVALAVQHRHQVFRLELELFRLRIDAGRAVRLHQQQIVQADFPEQQRIEKNVRPHVLEGIRRWRVGLGVRPLNHFVLRRNPQLKGLAVAGHVERSRVDHWQESNDPQRLRLAQQNVSAE